MIDKIDEFRRLVHFTHDTHCNQKYSITLPYSFHLNCVELQGTKFINLIMNGVVANSQNEFSEAVSYKDIVKYALIAHDLIEDGRMTYNDVIEMVNKPNFGNYEAAVTISDIVYCVTDEKGKNRGERKNSKYYTELSKNNLAVFVKLADIAANTLFSKLTTSSMYNKYKSEFKHFKSMCYKEQYKEFFEYVENL